MARTRILKNGLLGLALIMAAYLAWDWQFWVRQVRSPTDDTLIYDINWYTPRARIAEGTGREIPRATAADSRIDPQALATGNAGEVLRWPIPATAREFHFLTHS